MYIAIKSFLNMSFASIYIYQRWKGIGAIIILCYFCKINQFVYLNNSYRLYSNDKVMHRCITRNKMYQCIKLECRISQNGMLPMQRETKYNEKIEQNNVWVIKETKVLLVAAKNRFIILISVMTPYLQWNTMNDSYYETIHHYYTITNVCILKRYAALFKSFVNILNISTRYDQRKICHINEINVKLKIVPWKPNNLVISLH